MKKTISIVSSLIKMMIRTAAENKKSDKAVLAKDLPTAVKFFVQCNFPNGHIAFAEMRLTSKGTIYSVSLNNGIQMVFNENGSWEMVDCKMGAVPTTLVPAKVQAFMDAYYFSTPIVKIAKNDNGYEVTLSNYSTLQFSKLENVA